MYKSYKHNEQILEVVSEIEDSTLVQLSYYDRGDIYPSLVREVPRRDMETYINRFFKIPAPK